MNKIQEKIKKHEEAIEKLKAQLEDSNEYIPKKTVIVDGVEYEDKDHDFDKELSNIKIPKGWRLWKPSEVWKLYEDRELRKKLNLENCWFFVHQPRDNTSDVARFGANSDGAYLLCNRYPDDRDDSLGVRFCRDVRKKEVKK